MRFARLGPVGQEKPAVWDGESWRDVSGVVAADGSFADATTRGAAASALAAGGLPPLPESRFGPPLTGIGKIVCIGLNYRDHAAETGATEPLEPVMFMKAPDTVVGAHDDVLVPRKSTKTDWEVELGVVIGKTTRYMEDQRAAIESVAGYVMSNDVSEREFQTERGGQWDKGKNCETFNPMGPWFVTADEVGNPQALVLRLWVNGVLRQNGTTENMIFGVAHIVWYLSQFMTLYPGDVINTGTPAGVALGLPDQPYLRPGDVVELEIDGLGRQRQLFKAA